MLFMNILSCTRKDYAYTIDPLNYDMMELEILIKSVIEVG